MVKGPIRRIQMEELFALVLYAGQSSLLSQSTIAEVKPDADSQSDMGESRVWQR